MTEFKSAEPQLWEHARKQPYIEKKSFTNVKHFTPDYPEGQQLEFTITELRQIKWCRKAESNR